MFFHRTNIAQIDYNDKSVDGVLGTRTRDGRMVGADESSELWRYPTPLHCLSVKLFPSLRPLSLSAAPLNVFAVTDRSKIH